MLFVNDSFSIVGFDTLFELTVSIDIEDYFRLYDDESDYFQWRENQMNNLFLFFRFYIIL